MPERTAILLESLLLIPAEATPCRVGGGGRADVGMERRRGFPFVIAGLQTVEEWLERAEPAAVWISSEVGGESVYVWVRLTYRDAFEAESPGRGSPPGTRATRGSARQSGTATDSYWDTQTSGQSESAGGEGKTTSELQSPTGYTEIYESWNLDLDGVGDDL